jgi:dipeptidyl aminopeptidase/acylaminoacyl peptidase
MPLESNPAIDMNLELTKGVLPAIDKLIELGVADPERVALMGHSLGGFATYGLVTQTNRFKAAIAISGFSDLLSLYNSVFPTHRYLSYIDEDAVLPWQAGLEGLYRMGNPPWRDLARYLRNSPITNVDRVRSPLLIIHGDMDFVPIEQAEEFFNALYRQGKRARFIRYWGEWHLLNSPANIRDFWNQVYAWLDEFCDISRDGKGNLIFDRDHVKSRNGAPAMKPEDFAGFDEMELKLHPWVKQ